MFDIFNQVTQGLAYTISSHWAHWLELFYHQHRMAHLPKVRLLPILYQYLMNISLCAEIFFFLIEGV